MNSIRDDARDATARLTVRRRDDSLRRMSGHPHHHGHDHAGEWRTLAALAGACGLLGLGALATELSAGPAWLRWALAAAAKIGRAHV